MLKALGQTLLGFLLTAAGFYLLFVALIGIADQTNVWFFLPAIPLIAGGIVLLLRAGKSDALLGVKKAKVKITLASKDEASLAATLEKNNAMDQQWSKTNDARNRLKMLQLSADAQKGS